MKSFQFITQTLFVVACALTAGTKSFAEPVNLGQLKMELRSYQTSGQYQKEIEQMIQSAKTYINQKGKDNATSQQPKKLALVLDIDETSISNYHHISGADFCTNKTSFDREIASGKDPVIPAMLDLYKDARKNNIAVFFITGRPATLEKATIKNLKAAGYEGWAGLYFRPQTDKQPSIVPFKTQARAAIEASGYTVIASIGDQQSDLEGGHAEKTFKLPNPYYYIP